MCVKSNITVHNVENVVLAADFLYHEEMKKECERIMLLNLDVSKLMSYYKLSQKADLSILNTDCLTLAKENFTEVAHSSWFLGLTIDEAHVYLQDDDLNITTEDDVLFAVLRWLKNSNEPSAVIEQHSKRLFQCVRLKFCQSSTLESVSADETIMDPLRLKIFEFLHRGRHGQGAARKAYSAAHSISAAFKKIPSASVPGTRAREKLPPPAPVKVKSQEPPTASGKASKSSAKLSVQPPLKKKEEVLIVGGRKTGNARHENIIFLDKDPRDCIMTEAPVCAAACNSSVCALSKNAIIVSGGYNSTPSFRSITKVQKFTITDNRWVDLPDLPFPVDCHGSAYTNASYMHLVDATGKMNRQSSCTPPSVYRLNHTILGRGSVITNSSFTTWHCNYRGKRLLHRRLHWKGMVTPNRQAQCTNWNNNEVPEHAYRRSCVQLHCCCTPTHLHSCSHLVPVI